MSEFFAILLCIPLSILIYYLVAWLREDIKEWRNKK